MSAPFKFDEEENFDSWWFWIQLIIWLSLVTYVIIHGIS